MIGNDPSPRADPGSALSTSESSGIRLDAGGRSRRTEASACTRGSGRLIRDVSEEDLDLVQVAAGEVAQSGTGASQIVRGWTQSVRMTPE